MWIVLIILLLLLALLLSSPRFKGARGEQKVQRQIEKLVKGNPCYLPHHDLTLRTLDGSTQIDHVLITCFGIFVIETKNLGGWVFGSQHQKQWTQTFKTKKFKFQNPLHQNFKHLKAIQNALNINANNIHSVVVFTGSAKFKSQMPQNVIYLRQLRSFLLAHTIEIFSPEEVGRFYSILSNSNIKNSDIRKKHIANLQINRRNPICPKCGKPMVIRTAKRGKNAGSKFWGCPGYPSCRSTKPMA